MLVVTGDRDSLQLVSDDVTVLYPRKGVSELTRFTPEAVVAKYGLTPPQYPDFAALRGDPSDNLPGIPGVGEKTATKWIVEYGSLQALVDQVDDGQGQGRRRAARQPVAASCSTASSPSWSRTCRWRRPRTRCGMQPWDRDQIHRLFDDLEFRVLRERLFDTLAVGRARGRRGLRRRAAVRSSPATVAAWLAEHASDGSAVRAGRGRHPPGRSTATPPRWRSPPPTATAATSTPPR